ncbi:glutamine amidotransferase [Ktedonobacter sp. SOSP1-52]|uniref:anthranilate synthase component II n=1 Tax=Ktedonobacter sp. SOSP1-52 TaxID=2778366 RepID=UPI00191564B9|nr:aminodeoxychorismate/anthranilate synthase component II [Ktedonobacter sp. SOSP1-52]GHO65455.1 glutamine amidotransferase [Ktedonobacter sp. SOSP1-52]
MLLLIDNYDSFTYNLYQYFAELGANIEVRRNDKITLAEIEQLQPTQIVISPGPCTPNEAGLSCQIIETFGPRIPILGVCLGHQAIGQVYGGRVVRAPELKHGKTSLIYHRRQGILYNLPSPFEACRYHSLIVERASLPNALEITAETEDGLIMGLRHRKYAIEGVQFHPESILTPVGKDLLRNFLLRAQRRSGIELYQRMPAA